MPAARCKHMSLSDGFCPACVQKLIDDNTKTVASMTRRLETAEKMMGGSYADLVFHSVGFLKECPVEKDESGEPFIKVSESNLVGFANRYVHSVIAAHQAKFVSPKNDSTVALKA